MKTALSAIATAVLLGLLGYAFGRPLQLYDYALILFAASLVVWTFEQYDTHHHHPF